MADQPALGRSGLTRSSEFGSPPASDFHNELSKSQYQQQTEEEYKQLQSKLTEEELNRVQQKVKLMQMQSRYTSCSHSIGDIDDPIEEEQNITWGKETKEEVNLSNLLQVFSSSSFNMWMGVSYLYRHPSPGVHDYLCNALYHMPDDEVEFYLVELCTMIVQAQFATNALERFILDKCKQSVHFALQVNWLMEASMGESEAKRRASELFQSKCEIAVVNGTFEQPQLSALLYEDHSVESASDLRKMQKEGSIHSPANSRTGLLSTDAQNDQEDNDNITSEALEKLDRCDYFYKIINFVQELGFISDKLRLVPVRIRQRRLEQEITKLNSMLAVGIYLPLWQASSSHYSIISVIAKESRVLKSRERVPFILLLETIESKEHASSRSVPVIAKYWHEKVRQDQEREIAANTTTTTCSASAPSLSLRPESRHSGSESPRVDTEPDEDSDWVLVSNNIESKPRPASDSVGDYSNSPFGEPFAKKVKRIRKTCKYGEAEGWGLKSVIIKFGDDCRQEYLALQLITEFQRIFQSANLPIYIRPYRISINSPSSGIIETITDSISIDGLKKFYSTDEKASSSLLEHFRRFYKDENSEAYKLAVRNFVESLAGYSLVCYMMQIKDRHNGNILIDSEGHLIHIDFGFILSNSPGAINAENVPFKFTLEYLEVMGGFDSHMFQYFKDLLLNGYFEIRKNHEKILLLVEIMAVGSNLPCFSAGRNTIKMLHDRFNLHLNDKQVVEFVGNMMDQSFDSWRTRYYDRFQYMTNNILY